MNTNDGYCYMIVAQLVNQCESKDATIARLEAENAALRERAEGLARECVAWRDGYQWYVDKQNDGEGDPILGEVMFDIPEDIRKATDAAGWLTANGGGGGQ